MAVIGAVLINADIFPRLQTILQQDDFYIVRHRWIWDAYCELATRGTPIDFLTVTEELESAGQLGEIGGPAYLTALINQVPTSLHADAYAEMVKNCAERRKGLTFANEIAQAAYDETKDFDMAEWGLKLSHESTSNAGAISTKQAAQQAKHIIQDTNLVFSTGISDLDRSIGGLFPGELTVVGGYPGTGKSAWLIQIARANAVKRHKIMLVSLEMTAAQIWLRMACGDLGVDLNKLRSNQLPKETVAEVEQHIDNLAGQYGDRIVIYPAPMTLGEILSAARSEMPGLIGLDHLGLVAGRPKNMDKVEFYTEVARFLRQQVALPWVRWNKDDPGRSVVVLHHINRSSSRENRRPTINDLDYAGEKDADCIVLQYRDEKFEAKTAGLAKVEFITGKARFGWTGTIDTCFNLPRQHFAGWQTDNPKHSNYRIEFTDQ